MLFKQIYHNVILPKHIMGLLIFALSTVCDMKKCRQTLSKYASSSKQNKCKLLVTKLFTFFLFGFMF